MTNLQKSEQAWEILDQRLDVFVDSLFPNGRPTKFYAVGRLDAIERKVTSFGYRFPVWRNSKPTRKDVEAVRALVEILLKLEASKVVVHWKEPNCSGATDLGEIGVPDQNSAVMLAWTLDEIAPAMARNKEWYTPREGYAPCQYCGQQRKLEDLHQQTIISPNWKATGFRSPPRNYCKDKPCAGYDQMAHEG